MNKQSQSDKDGYIEQLIISLSEAEEEVRKLKRELHNAKEELEIEKSRRDMNLEQMLSSLESRYEDKFNLLSQEYENVSEFKKNLDDRIIKAENEKKKYKDIVNKLEKENKLLITEYLSKVNNNLAQPMTPTAPITPTAPNVFTPMSNSQYEPVPKYQYTPNWNTYPQHQIQTHYQQHQPYQTQVNYQQPNNTNFYPSSTENQYHSNPVTNNTDYNTLVDLS